MIDHASPHPRRTIVQIGLFALALGTASPVSAQNAPALDFVPATDDDIVVNNADIIVNTNGRERIRLDGSDGSVGLRPTGTPNENAETTSVHLGSNGSQTLGGAGTDGLLVLRNGANRPRISMHADTGDVVVGLDGSRGRVTVRNAAGNRTIRLDGESGRLGAREVETSGQIKSEHSSSGEARGVDTASLYLESRNPAIGLLDTTSDNIQGWYIQSGSEGQLVFKAGTTGGLEATMFTMSPDGAICLGATC